MIADLLRDGPIVVNLGLRDFADSVEAQGAPVVHVEWVPPRELDPRVAEVLEKLG